jgi:SAM-dependent methyltransferase
MDVASRGTVHAVKHDDYYAANRSNWSERVSGHWMPDGYDAPGFIAEQDRISGVVEFDRSYLGDLEGGSLLHLQCHFGMDTLSLARLGATVTGIDFSTEAVVAARRLSDESGTPGRFVETELYLTPRALSGEQFDVVYTGVGAINWLPDIVRWGEVVATMLRPGGMFYMRECHPAAWSLRFPIDDPHDETLIIEHPYFEVVDPISWDINFGDVGSATIENTRVYEWNHGIGEIMSALTSQGLTIDLYREHRFLEWQGQHHMAQGVDGRWRLPESQRDLLPLMYSLRARKG